MNAPVAASGPLSGLRVLDLTRYIAGPFCGQLLADAGAEVIKVEPPGGETSRHEPPQVQIDDDFRASLLFMRFNRGKKSVVLDTRTEEGLQAFAKLVESADILIENFRPGMLESWGFGWDRLHEINPRLIYATVSGFGYENSPLRDFPAFNTIAESVGGLVSKLPDGDTPPQQMGLPAADGLSGLFNYIGVLQAVIERHNTGLGRRVDVAMYDTVVTFNDHIVANAAVAEGAGEQPPKVLLAPFGYYQASDGWLVVGVGTDRQWRLLCEIAGWDDWLDGRYDDRHVRVQVNEEIIRPRLTEWLRQHRAWDVAHLLAGRGIPAGPLQSGAEILRDPQAAARGMIRRYQTNDGELAFVGNQFGVAGAAGDTTDFPRLGEHTEQYITK